MKVCFEIRLGSDHVKLFQVKRFVKDLTEYFFLQKQKRLSKQSTYIEIYVHV